MIKGTQSGRSVVAIWLPLVLGVLLSVAAARGVHWYNENRMSLYVNTLADRAEAEIEKRFGLYEYGLRGTRGAIVSVGAGKVTRVQFERYIASRENEREFPGALGFGFIRRVPMAQEAAFVALARQDGAPQFSVRTLTPHQGDRFIIQYIYPLRGNEQAVGLDIASETNRRTAALAAARDGRLHLTAPITLVQADGKPRRGFLIMLPVYRTGAQRDTPDAREKALAGWVYAPLVVDDVLRGLGNVFEQSRITIADSSAPDPFYSSSPDEARTLPQQAVRDIDIMGQHWRLRLEPYDSVIKTLGLWPGWWAFVLGLGLTCLVVMLSQREHLEAARGEDGSLGLAAFSRSPMFRRYTPPILVALVLLWGGASWVIADGQFQAVRQDLDQATVTTRGYLQKAAARYGADVRFLSNMDPVQHLMREARSMGTPVGNTSSQWRERLADIFQAYMQANPEIYQVRLIEAGPDWREAVRVNRLGSRLEVVPPSGLQAKAGRTYIDGTLRAGAGRVHVSELNLNREQGVVERPLHPVWRFSILLVHADRRPYGMIIINVSAGPLLQKAVSQHRTAADYYVTNLEGDFLWHPQKARTFTYEFGHPYRWADEFRVAEGWLEQSLTGLEAWHGPLGAVWSERTLFLPNAPDDFGGIYIAAARPQFPVYRRIALQIGEMLLFCLALAAVATGLQYRNWVHVRQREQADGQRQRALLEKRENALFKALLESAPDATIIVDERGIIELVNAQAEQLFGYSRQQMQGQPVEMLIRAEPLGEAPASVAEFLHHPQSVTPERVTVFQALHADGSEFQVELGASRVQLEDSLLEYVSVYDVRERLEAEGRLRQALQSAQAATQAKSAFLANTSHEIRTPLNAIIGLTRLLSEGALSREQQQLVAKIQISGRTLLGIVNDVLDLSKIEANEIEMEWMPVDLREVLEDIGSIFSIQAEAKQLDFHLVLDDQLPAQVIIDPTRLRQVVFNLLGNALKFTESGSITLKAEVLAPDEGPAAEDTRVRISVRDTGIGIAQEAQAQLFKPFSQADATTNRRFGGTGLGLSIVKRLTELMGGSVGVESTPGEGSCFRVELLLRRPSEVDLHVEESQNMALFVIVAEDDPGDASQMQQMCRLLGWRVQLVRDGFELVEVVTKRLENSQRRPDVLILDWQMPLMDGLQALDSLTEKFAHDELPAVLMVSNFDAAHIAKLDQRHLVQGILHKPLDASALFNAVNEAVVRNTGDTSRVSQVTRLDAVEARWLPEVQVLVADDSEINLEVVSQLLQRNGAVVDMAESGYAALEFLQAKADVYDVVLMDVQMPGMDGLETTHRMRNELGLEKLPVLALTAGALVEERQRALAAGMNDFLTKPIDPTQLINTVRKVVREYRGREIAVLSMQEKANEGVFWPEIDGLNAEVAKVRLEGDARLLLTVLEQMLKEHAQVYRVDPLEIDRPEAGGLRLAIARQAHKLRSAAGSIGAERIQTLASEAESALRTEDQPAGALLAKLDQALRDLEQASAEVLAAGRSRQEAAMASALAQGEAQAVSPEILARIMKALSENDLAALDEVNQLAPALRVALGSEGYQTLEDCLNRLDFQGARQLLEALDQTDGGL